MILLFLSVCILGSASSNSIADKFLDTVLSEHLEKAIKNLNLDPAPLPDFGIPFRIELGPIPISGKVDFNHGILNGLSRIRRLLSCQGPSISLGDVKLECGLNFYGMDAVYDGKARIGILPPIPFQVTAYVNETTARSVISGAPASLRGQLKLLEITKFGDINVRLSNLGPFQYIYNAVEERFRERVREELISIILNQFPVPFVRAITQVKLPGLPSING